MTSAWPPESSRRGRQRGTARLAIEQGADDGGDGAWPARLGADDGGAGAWPTGDVAWPAGDGARPTGLGAAGMAGWRKGQQRSDWRKELFIPVLQFVLQYLFGHS